MLCTRKGPIILFSHFPLRAGTRTLGPTGPLGGTCKKGPDTLLVTGTSLRRRAKRVNQSGGSGGRGPATYSNIPLPPTGLKEPYPCYVNKMVQRFPSEAELSRGRLFKACWGKRCVAVGSWGEGLRHHCVGEGPCHETSCRKIRNEVKKVLPSSAFFYLDPNGTETVK